MFFHFIIFFKPFGVNVPMAIFVHEIIALILYSTMLAGSILVNLLLPFVLKFSYGRCVQGYRRQTLGAAVFLYPHLDSNEL
jgi:hypothetical protein